MSFQITGLDAAPFRRFYGLSDEELQSFGVKRLIARRRSPGFPDRIELRDVEEGEALLLLNYLHQPADTPYKASHAIFVREWAETPYRAVDEIPGRASNPSDFASRLRRLGRHGRRRSHQRRMTSRPPIERLFANRRPPTSMRITPSAAATRRGSIGREAGRGVAPSRFVT